MPHFGDGSAVYLLHDLAVGLKVISDFEEGKATGQLYDLCLFGIERDFQLSA